MDDHHTYMESQDTWKLSVSLEIDIALSSPVLPNVHVNLSSYIVVSALSMVIYYFISSTTMSASPNSPNRLAGHQRH